MSNSVSIYTDGSCKGNPGPGGWAAIIIDCGKKTELTGGAPHTTNNRMELTAVISALKTLKMPTEVKLYSDSQYITNAINQHWLDSWKRNNWTRPSGPVLNSELWQELDRLLGIHKVTFIWVKGHNHNALNNRADQLAVAESAKYTGMPRASAPSPSSRAPSNTSVSSPSASQTGRSVHADPIHNPSSVPSLSPVPVVSSNSSAALRCPFCGGPVHITVHDLEGNLHDEEYEKEPWSGLCYGLAHRPEDEIGLCPIASEEMIGRYMYSSRESAAKAWSLKPC